ncbi:hypothetical protein [Nocardia niigatensis]
MIPANVVDEAAHHERVALDAQIAELTEQLQVSARSWSKPDHHQGLVRLQELQRSRRDAYRREVGWTA